MSVTAKRMKQRRIDLGISAEELAESINVSRSTIFRYESGDIDKLSISALPALAAALRTTPEYLMGWEDNPEKIRHKHDPVASEAPMTRDERLREYSQQFEDLGIYPDTLTHEEMEEIKTVINYVLSKRKSKKIK